ncbi:phospholipid-binding protein MlaC [Aquabacterium sp.]|uniref:MlaC/ttg2D family ABC transporter substrate-binding protein n=1 Tax=Aquabacterium sp. TaxID=1872578 RepID=UPI0035B04D2B
MFKRWMSVVNRVLLAVSIVSAPLLASAQQATAPDELVKQLSTQVLETAKRDKGLQSGDVAKLTALVNTVIMPHVNFERMTASAVGKYWRQANPQQKQRLQDEFKALLVHTYAGALSQVKDQTIEYRPMRSKPEDTEVVVRSFVRGKGDPVQLDYRLEKSVDGWKIYDVNVLGAWLVENYRNSFSQEISASGIDGLIAKLSERNKTNAGSASGAAKG